MANRFLKSTCKDAEQLELVGMQKWNSHSGEQFAVSSELNVHWHMTQQFHTQAFGIKKSNLMVT